MQIENQLQTDLKDSLDYILDECFTALDKYQQMFHPKYTPVIVEIRKLEHILHSANVKDIRQKVWTDLEYLTVEDQKDHDVRKAVCKLTSSITTFCLLKTILSEQGLDRHAIYNTVH